MDSFRQLKGQWDRVAAVAFTVAGAVLMVLGWFGVAGQGLTADQMPYIASGGLGGIFLMGVGAALWLSADLRDEWMKLDRIEEVLEYGLDQLGLGRGMNGRPTLAPLEPDDRWSSVPEAPRHIGSDVVAQAAYETGEVQPEVGGARGWTRRAQPTMSNGFTVRESRPTVQSD
jgi:hypothetical protein